MPFDTNCVFVGVCVCFVMVLTCRRLLELLTLLLPPLPGLQQAAEGGELAPGPDGRGVRSGDQGL